jgi:signal transduction histidine kinase
LVTFLCLGVPISNSAKLSKSDSTKLVEIEAKINLLLQDNNHEVLALTYINQFTLEKKALKDTAIYFNSLRNAIFHSKKSSNLNLEFYCLYILKHAQYRINLNLQKNTALDFKLHAIADSSAIEDSLQLKIHQLWGNIYFKHNYHILALNQYLIVQDLALALNNEERIVANAIHLLDVYNVLKDEDSFLKTQATIEMHLPQSSVKQQLNYYLSLRSIEFRYDKATSESYLKKALELSKKSNKFEFHLNRQLAIYYLDNSIADSALATIKFLENKFLVEEPFKEVYAQIYIEELYTRYSYLMGDFNKAQTHYLQALEYCDEMRAPYIKRKLLLLAFQITEEIDDYRQAYEALRSLKLLEDSTMNRSQLIEYQKLKKQLYTEQVSKKISELEYARIFSELNLENKNKNILWLSSTTIALAAIILVIFFSYQQKRRRSKELQALNNLKDFIFSVISHDLRSPLYNFNTLLSMAENKYLKEEEYSEYLKTIQTELLGITGVTESLLRWAKSNQGLLQVNLTHNSLLDILTEVKDVFKPELVERNIHIISNFIYDFEIKTDKDLFTFILRNIVQNAIKFSEHDSQIEINAKKNNDLVVIEVVDHGAGMSKEQLKNINQKISSPSSDIAGVKSTGLGLIIAKDFAKRLNIQNDIKSEVGKGTSISLTFSSPSA